NAERAERAEASVGSLRTRPALFIVTMRIARRYLISGRVQGVGFRWFAERAAQRDNLHGWIRNLPDGRVEAFVEGDAEAIQRFAHAVGHGPAGARVEQVDAEAAEPTGRDTGFNIR